MKSSFPRSFGSRTAGRRKASTWPRSPVCSERVATADAGATPSAVDHQSQGFADRLWREHNELASELTRIERAAEAIGDLQLPASALLSELESAHELLAGRIVPHLRSADDYQKALARRDYVSSRAHPEHEEAERLASKLGRLRERVSGGNVDRARRDVRRLLYDLHALTRPHFGAQRGLK